MLMSIAGYGILVLMTVLLFFLSTFQSLVNDLLLTTLIMAAVVIGLLYGKKQEWVSVREEKPPSELGREDLFNFLSVVGGALITFMISIDLGLGAVVAAGLVAIIATLVLPKYDVPIYCGAFVGMACVSLLHTYHHLFLAGVIAGIVFVVTRDVFNGFGGKLGTIAFTGCVVAALFTRSELGSAPIPDWETGRYLIFYSILGALLTYILNVRFYHSAVISSGIVGLSAGLILPVIYPAIGEMLGVMVICASFAGMSSIERIPNEIVICVAGLFCALAFMYSAPYFGGAGGKLGTIAFGSVISLRGMLDIARYLKGERAVSFLQKGVEKEQIGS